MNLNHKILFILLFAVQAFGGIVHDDLKLLTDGSKIILNNNSQTFSISASGSMSESVDYILPAADGTGGQALLTDGSGVLSFGIPSTSAAHNVLSITHDAVAQAVLRGSIIIGNATPKWDELVIGTGVLHGDGTDVTGWSTVDISDDTNLTVAAPITLTDDDIGFDDSAYSLIDGTRSFTGTVGGILPVASSDLATKEYVDTAISFIFEFFFNDTASNIGGIYFKMLDTTTGEAESSFTTAALGTGDDQALTNFATEPGFPGVTELVEGIYEGHIHVEKTVGTKPVKIHYEIYSRATDTTETLIATSEESDFITSKVEISIHATLASEVMILTTDRIIIKWLANVDATGSAATVVLYAEGTNASHLAMPTSTEVLNQIYIRQDGTKELTANWDAGPFNIRSQTGTFDSLTSGRISIVSTNGLLIDDSDLTFATDTLTATKIGVFEAAGAINFASQNMTNVDIDSGTVDNISSLTASGDLDIGGHGFRANTLTADGLTPGRVPFISTNGLLIDSVAFTYSPPAGGLLRMSGSRINANGFGGISDTPAPMQQGIYVGVLVDASHIDDSTHGASSTTLYIGDETIDTSPCDERMKINTVDSEIDAVSVLQQLQVKDTDWKSPEKQAKYGRSTVLVAQDVYKILPYCARAPVDPNDNWSVRGNMIVPITVKAIQELRAENQEQRVELQTQQAQIEDLTNRVKVLEMQ